MSSLEDKKVEMFFLPWIMARGHMIPVIDAARIFAAHGAKVTIITTPGYAQLFQKPIEGDQSLGHDISFHTFKLPTAEFGLPDGCENLLHGSVGIMEKIYLAVHRAANEQSRAEPSRALVCLGLFIKILTTLAVQKLQEPIEQLVRERRPNCIVSHMFHPWTADLGARLGIPRILFYVTGLYPLCCEENLRRYAPHDKVNSDTETFALPGLPDDNLIFTKKKIPFWFKDKGTGWGQFLDMVIESELKSYGVMVNSFYGMESAYAEYFKNEMGRKLWLVGPVFLVNNEVEQKAETGQKNSIDGGTVLNWLDSKEPKSVLYVSFGSLVSMHPEQFLELAHGLEASGCPFIWVARDAS
ncbi:hypothetical protein ACSBR1_003370 [Camellia fascicularis]